MSNNVSYDYLSDVEIHVGHRSTRKRRKRVSTGQAYGQDVGGSSVSDGINVLDPTKQPTDGINDGNFLNCFTFTSSTLNHHTYIYHCTMLDNYPATPQDTNVTTTQSRAIDECGDELIYEDNQSEEDYMFAGQGYLRIPSEFPATTLLKLL